MEFKVRNVNEAFDRLVRGIHDGTIKTEAKPSRNGEVLMIEEPVIIAYRNPKERVLFNVARDCNPFFHLYESLWMLAGRNDIAPLIYYNAQMANYSDDGTTQNGAYGYRWRHAAMSAANPGIPNAFGEGVDQLSLIIDHLKRKPESRRVVLQMWNVEDDLLKIDPKQMLKMKPAVYSGGTTAQYNPDDPTEYETIQISESKDVCCNLCAMFSIEDSGSSDAPRYLNMTVINRSNDLVWGALGANVVHFSFLQEYVALALGCEVGTYYQITNNLHVYTDKWNPLGWEKYAGTGDLYSSERYGESLKRSAQPLYHDRPTFDMEVQEIVEYNKNRVNDQRSPVWDTPFLKHVAQRVFNAWHRHKIRDYEGALDVAATIGADDWRIACTSWLERRRGAYNARESRAVEGAD